jgi:hypothetical protein
MAGVLFTITSTSGEPSLGRASELLGVDASALDPAFGVRLIDPRKHLYAVLVDDAQAPHVRTGAGSVEGPFSNPGISDFGPLQEKKKAGTDR